MATGYKVFIATVAMLALVAAVSWYYFFRAVSVSGVEFALQYPDEVKVGEPFTVTTLFSNDSDRVLADASVFLNLPNGLAVVGGDPNQRVITESLGDAGPGSVSKQEFTLIALGETQILQAIAARVEYAIADNPTGRYGSDARAELRIERRAAPVTIAVPERSLAGEPIEIKITYRNESAADFRNARLSASFPPAFQFKNAEPDATQGNNEWNIPILKKGEEKEIVVSGLASAAAGSFLHFTVAFSVNLLGRDYVITEEAASLSVSPSPLSLAITANNKAEYVSRLEDTLAFNVRYKNNAAMPLANVSVRAKLVGEMFDFTSVNTNAFFNSVTNTFSWNASNASQLASVPSGSEGTLPLSIKVKPAFPIRRLGDKNYTLLIEAAAESPTVLPESAGEKTVSLSSLEVPIRGKLEVDARAYFRDAAANAVNGGPYPPRVNQTTQYTVHWAVKNHATNVSNAAVSAFLQSGAKFVKVISSTEAAQPEYNAASGEVRWNIGTIPAVKGVLSDPAEAVFQIEYTPNINEAGRAVEILGTTAMQADDDFTDVTLQAGDGPLTTDLPDDTSITVSDRRVQP